MAQILYHVETNEAKRILDFVDVREHLATGRWRSTPKENDDGMQTESKEQETAPAEVAGKRKYNRKPKGESDATDQKGP